MFENFYPKEYVKSAYSIDYNTLYSKGFRGILFDIDNTLVRHGAKASKESIELFAKLKSIGFKTCLISNNKEPRVKPFADNVNSPYIYNAHKPSIKNYIQSMFIMETNIHNTIFIGDQIFTDIYGANRAGMYTILVEPIHPKEEIQIILKRRLEKPILYLYKKQVRDKK